MENCDYRIILGATIRRLRESQGLSQRKLALMAGTNQTHLWQIETGQINVGINLLHRIAEALGVKTRDLIEF